MNITEGVLSGLRWLLLCFNLAALCVAVGLAPAKQSWAYQGPPDAVSLWFASHETGSLPWLLLASVIFSVGVYVFVQMSRLTPAPSAETGRGPEPLGATPLPPVA